MSNHSNLYKLSVIAFAIIGVSLFPSGKPGLAEEKFPMTKVAKENLPAGKSEAVGRARWLHETIHGALQVMHRDYFGDGDDDSMVLPSQALQDVFKEMARSWSVNIRWLGVNAGQDEEHNPRDDFEKAAAKALINGKTEFSAVEGNKFRFVGAITLHNQCLKCHVPFRSSLENRVAGLAITMPMKAAGAEEAKPAAE